MKGVTKASQSCGLTLLKTWCQHQARRNMHRWLHMVAVPLCEVVGHEGAKVVDQSPKDQEKLEEQGVGQGEKETSFEEQGENFQGSFKRYIKRTGEA